MTAKEWRTMDPDWRQMAGAAGLQAALEAFPNDVEAAARAAAAAASGVAPVTDPRREPWPPMRMMPAP